MAYANAQADPRTKIANMLAVGGLHVVVGMGLVAALGVTVLQPDRADNPRGEIIEIEIPPAPPPPEPVDQNLVEPVSAPSVITAPEPLIKLTPPSGVEVFPPDGFVPDVVRNPTFTIDPAPIKPRPTPTFTPTAPIPRNGPQGWITNNDYPGSDLRRGNEGTAQYRVVVGSDGRVSRCEIIVSTGHPGLDDATCRHIERRARFDPAKNGEAKPGVGNYTGSVTWQIPQ